jgi:hypothetical protein
MKPAGCAVPIVVNVALFVAPVPLVHSFVCFVCFVASSCGVFFVASCGAHAL